MNSVTNENISDKCAWERQRQLREDKIRNQGGIVNKGLPKHREEILKWNGWGFKDTNIELGEEEGKQYFQFTGNRYPFANQKMPRLPAYMEKYIGVTVNQRKPSHMIPPPDTFPKSSISDENLSDLDSLNVPYSLNGMDRLMRGHGMTLDDMMYLRDSSLPKIPDVVVWPSCHDDVVKVVELADARNMVVIPFGGGSAVTGACNCPETEKRTVLVVDTTQMANILWIDEDNLTACCEAGITGSDLEENLASKGYTCGHEPDSYELSTLGGWIATRASGMKKNAYGNIEDIVVHAKMVTPRGVLDKKTIAPRMSCGPDFDHIILGSEGTLGIVTEVVVKIQPLPEVKRMAAYVFRDFETGYKMVREVARLKCQPASIRLMDNEQFQFGHAFKPDKGYFTELYHSLEMFYVTKIAGFKYDEMSLLTVLYEGSRPLTDSQEKTLHAIAKKFGGIYTGEQHGRQGYSMTFLIAYIRDFLLDYGFIGESYETAVPWNKTFTLINNLRMLVKKRVKIHKIDRYKISFRITQTYDAGCVIYFYFGFSILRVPEGLKLYNEIEDVIRDEIQQVGACVSHHHGIGKRRALWYPQMASKVGVDIYEATKNRVDPNNIFGCGNIVPRNE